VQRTLDLDGVGFYLCHHAFGLFAASTLVLDMARFKDRWLQPVLRCTFAGGCRPSAAQSGGCTGWRAC
jgi:hypothetical protein